MSIKKQLLDPIGTMCKLVALNFCIDDTKISIQNHVLTLQYPNSYQFLIRLYNGDGRENVSELYYVIIRLIKWYVIASDEENNAQEIGKSIKFRKMIEYLCKGLKKLQSTYKYGNVILSLQCYINLLEDSLNNKFDESSLPDFLIEMERKHKNFLDYDKLKNLWDVKRVNRIYDLYEQCFDIIESTTITKSNVDAFIQGYLKSVDIILTTTDKEFQKLIINNNIG